MIPIDLLMKGFKFCLIFVDLFVFVNDVVYIDLQGCDCPVYSSPENWQKLVYKKDLLVSNAPEESKLPGVSPLVSPFKIRFTTFTGTIIKIYWGYFNFPRTCNSCLTKFRGGELTAESSFMLKNNSTFIKQNLSLGQGEVVLWKIRRLKMSRYCPFHVVCTVLTDTIAYWICACTATWHVWFSYHLTLELSLKIHSSTY
jgi:hypothetical protein